MDDNELDKACTFLLVQLATMYPAKAKALTKQLNSPKFRSLDKLQKKITKIRILHAADPAMIGALFAEENAAWAREVRSDMSNFFYMLERRTTFLNPYGERTGGNYSAKA